MSEITKIDKNLYVANTFGRDDLVFYGIPSEPFSLYGVEFDDGCFRRLPAYVADRVNEGVSVLSKNTAGGRVCFKTDSDTVAIFSRRSSTKFPHMPFTGTSGFDLFVRENGRAKYVGTFIPDLSSDESKSVIKLPSRKMRELIIHFPLYSDVFSLSIGVKIGSNIEKWSGYTHDKPIVFYGSSITQGGCASIPGGDYISRISNKLDCDYINLGFSGSAKGEVVMMEYIAALDMSIFVYDYDHNAPTPEHLEKTHYKGYRTMRDANPDLPIILVPRPTYRPFGDELERRNIIEATYKRALAEGDENIYFVDSAEVFADFLEDGCSVDGSHPNDLGFARMADAIGRVIENILKK